jgi:hypothetical protein
VAAVWVLVAGCLAAAGAARAAEGADPWAALRFLLGEWEAPPSADGATGHTSFALELGGAVLVRVNHAEYPARDGRAAAAHDDHMVIYREGSPPALRALYVDGEGHVIHYAVATGASGRAEFLSDSLAPGPRYRLTYAALAGERLAGRFEIAPAARPDSFATYLEWTCRRPPAGSAKRPAGSARP